MSERARDLSAGGGGRKDKADIIALPPFIYGAALGIGLAIHAIYPVAFWPHRALRWVGLILVLSAFPIAVSALQALDRAKTPFDARKPTTAVVTDGPFRYSRNPMYLSATLLYLGIGTLVNSLWMVVLVIPLMLVIQRGVVEREEAYLERKFGDEYLRYKSRVRRWM